MPCASTGNHWCPLDHMGPLDSQLDPQGQWQSCSLVDQSTFNSGPCPYLWAQDSFWERPKGPAAGLGPLQVQAPYNPIANGTIIL